MRLSQKGSASAIFIIILIIASALFFLGRREIYATANIVAFNLGYNINNISKDSYVNWIKSQPEEQQSDQGIFLNKKVATYSKASQDNSVLGQTAQVDDSKWIEIDLSEQRLYLKQNGNTVNSFLVSTGKWAPTPTGEWRIWTKLRSTTMKGGSKALHTYYYLPNVPFTMYYYKGYGIHGAYWHNNFGQTMSHGCTNMKPEEAEIVFNFAQVGTRVIVRS